MKQRIKNWLAKTMPNVLSSLIFGIFNEGVFGLSQTQLAISRTIALLLRLFLSVWFFNLVTDVLRGLHHKKGQPIKYWLINGTCSMIFWVGLYFLILTIIGVSIQKVMFVIIGPTILSFLSGVPMRWVQIQLGRLFNVPEGQSLKDFFVSEIRNLLVGMKKFITEFVK